MPLDREQVLSALRKVNDPELHKDLVTLNQVKQIKIDGAAVGVLIDRETAGPIREVMHREIATALRQIGADYVQVDFTGPSSATPQPPRLLPQVKSIIAVGAGKGGVGKSTLALNIAVGLARLGDRVGLMDGDIYGPSMPTMLGIKGRPPMVNGSQVIPFHVHGIHAITIGAMVEAEAPLIWRGPMAHGAFKQLFVENTLWPALDYLIVDLPPGTGDVPLTLCQLLPITGAVIVATPQQVALDDAVRAVRMFQKLGAPILGMVENMSYLRGPDGNAIDIFGHGGAEKTAQRLNIPFLGALALHPELRQNSDAGTPTANFTGSNDALRDELQTIVHNLVGQVSHRLATAPAPKLTVE
jgi:ATP-binding protein involved in chromosome partitioning